MKPSKNKKAREKSTITKTFAKIGKAGKRIRAILGFVATVFGGWGIYKTITTKDVSGKWRLTFTVEKCQHKAYIGDKIVQETVFIQNEKSVTGKGEKTEYRGEYLASDQHRHIEYTGVIEGKQLNAAYVLHGLKRDTEGNIKVTISSDGKTMSGTFTGTIADDSGTVTGEKLD
jgi:hypothetical protein